MSASPYGTPEVPAVFPDWSPYRELEPACRAYLRDPEMALAALEGVLQRTGPFGFTLERFVNEVNGVWQEVAVCDGDRLVLWHGEDAVSEPAPEDPSAVVMTSSLRVVPLSAVTEVGCRRRLSRNTDGDTRVESVEVYMLLGSLDEVPVSHGPDDAPVGVVRHDALRFGKTREDGGLGQLARVEEFARLVAGRIGQSLA